MQKKSSADTTLELGLSVEDPNPRRKRKQRKKMLGAVGDMWYGRALQSTLEARTHCLHGHALTPDNLTARKQHGKIYFRCRQCFRHYAQISAARNPKIYTEAKKLKSAEYYQIHKEQLKREQRLRYSRSKGVQQRSARERAIRRLYGLSIEQYAHLVNDQNCECAICKTKMENPYIDHCHNTGKIRGILCPSCNHGLGMIETKGEAWVAKALDYVKKHSQ